MYNHDYELEKHYHPENFNATLRTDCPKCGGDLEDQNGIVFCTTCGYEPEGGDEDGD